MFCLRSKEHSTVPLVHEAGTSNSLNLKLGTFLLIKPLHSFLLSGKCFYIDKTYEPVHEISNNVET